MRSTELTETIELRRPVKEDGAAIYNLVKRCPPLDENSRYCNLLQTSHFRDSAVVAERDGELLGFVTGYRLPRAPDVLFVWQVAVSPAARGYGLGKRMLEALIERGGGIRFLETTVTPGNAASRRMFERLADAYEAPVRKEVIFKSEDHFERRHDDEVLFRIGPIDDRSRHAQTTH